MGKSKKPSPVAPAVIAARLGALAETLASSVTLSARERKTHRDRIRHVPDALVELVLTEAERSGGEIAGIPVDVASIRIALAEIVSARAAADAARRIAAQMDDHAMQRNGLLASRILGIYVALRRLVHTTVGKAHARVFEEMASAVRDERRPKIAAKKP